jgi:hypothetical protein
VTGSSAVIVLVLVAAAALVVAVAALLLRHHGAGPAAARPRVPISTPAATPTRPASPPRSLVRNARWQRTSQGLRLRVQPSSYGRRHAVDAAATALAEAIAAAGPESLSLAASQRQALTRQLRCHAEFAATKPRWDLEAWRPDVSYAHTILALCNP